jgi:hypothetical protein
MVTGSEVPNLTLHRMRLRRNGELNVGREHVMNLHRPVRTSLRIWLAISVPLFLAGWFIRGGKGGDEPMWEIWRVFITHDYICSAGEMLMGLGIYTLALAVPATVIGWILQFPLYMVLDYFHRQQTASPNGGPREPLGSSGVVGGPPSVS